MRGAAVAHHLPLTVPASVCPVERLEQLNRPFPNRLTVCTRYCRQYNRGIRTGQLVRPDQSDQIFCFCTDSVTICSIELCSQVRFTPIRTDNLIRLRVSDHIFLFVRIWSDYSCSQYSCPVPLLIQLSHSDGPNPLFRKHTSLDSKLQ